MSKRDELRAFASAVGLVAALLVLPVTAVADHCPGMVADEALESAASIVLVDVTGTRLSDDTASLNSYDFAVVRAYRGHLPHAFTRTGRELGCGFSTEDISPGDRFVMAIDPPWENGATVRTFWRLGAGDRVVDGPDYRGRRPATLRELERIMAGDIAPDTALLDRARTRVEPDLARSTAPIIAAVGTSLLFMRRRRRIVASDSLSTHGHRR